MASNLILAGRLAVITGAGGGIGRAICNLFAREGCAVAAIDVNHLAVEETVKGLHALTPDVKHLAVQADVSSKQDVDSMMNSVFEEFKRPASIAINNAGITRDRMLLKMTEDAFDKVIAVNLKSIFLVTQQFTKWLRDEKVEEGSIVNISSIVGKTGNIGQANYAAAKAGVIGITKTCAQELARLSSLLVWSFPGSVDISDKLCCYGNLTTITTTQVLEFMCESYLRHFLSLDGSYEEISRNGIRCNAVLPGFIETEMTAKVPEHLRDLTVEFTPLRKLGEPEDVAEACLFLASSKSKFITGATLEVTGGLQM